MLNGDNNHGIRLAHSLASATVVRSLFGRCSVVVQSFTEQRLNNGETTAEYQGFVICFFFNLTDTIL